MRCPKCSYVRLPSDSHVIKGICPACGIAYEKWKKQQKSQASIEESIKAGEVYGGHFQIEPDPSFSLLHGLKRRLTEVPEQVELRAFWGSAGLFVAFFFWGWSFILGGIDWQSIGGSFLHNANLPFHEFGHVLFSPFGRFISILGGSLFQVLMPLGIMIAFILHRRDNFSASIMLWWSGQNFIDISPYIADAPYRAIPLIRGLGDDYHDWGNLLSMIGAVDQATTVARVSFGIGTGFMLLSFLWGGYILYLQKQNLE
ncbi:hypothetical protein [Motiliproteus sp. MSK22-1]|uniref:hypothetical protein n=1 Tax=Motiliproteus sp. MSK22-1 TaxID=1897630 RepID=UPI000978C8BA|nr:hypothetical protein [Motiliproteus sp. MSK22-1]OMH38252.1 hypothetical protein BGP75_08360 [Motiliproteus sp. MSK22-1]